MKQETRAMKPLAFFAMLAAPLALSACTTARPAGPIEVTRFVAPDPSAPLGDARLFVETSATSPEQGLALAPYKAAVARELARYGYAENARSGAGQSATVSLTRSQLDAEGRRSPVSVGVGGSTGTFGSGAGVGIGINLGGGSDERIVSRLEVRIRDVDSGDVLWEGRAVLDAPARSSLAENDAAADALAEALFRDFPGNSGETILVEIAP